MVVVVIPSPCDARATRQADRVPVIPSHDFIDRNEPPPQRSTLRRQSGCAVALYRGPLDNAWYSAAICIGWIAVLQFRCKSVNGAAMPRNSWYSCGRETK
jgi:hypothetical protein